VLTAYAYWRLVCYLRARDNGRLAPVLIMRRVPLLLGLEQGGITPWGIRMDRNPFFSGNPMLDDVAQALGVRSADVSEYVASLKTNLVAWISDQRLRHCAGELALSNRKINEIALSCGYNDLPTFTRAFKRQFGLAPSEYRKKEQKPGSQQDSDPSTN
jgi:AraC-like DNA-binding protein